MNRWVKPLAHESADWVSKSADGWYRIAQRSPAKFDAFHIEALWAKPTLIGGGATLEDAQGICEKHRQRTPAPV